RTHARDFGLEARVGVEVVVLGDGLAVGEDLRGVRVLLCRHVADLFEQREIDVRLDVAHRAGVAVPVPRSAEVAAFLDHTDVFDAGLAQSSPREQPTESATDDHDVDSVGQRLPVERFDVGIVDVMGEGVGDFDVLLVAVGPEPLVPLFAVLASQSVRIERQDLGHRWRTVPVAPRSDHMAPAVHPVFHIVWNAGDAVSASRPPPSSASHPRSDERCHDAFLSLMACASSSLVIVVRAGTSSRAASASSSDFVACSVKSVACAYTRAPDANRRMAHPIAAPTAAPSTTHNTSTIAPTTTKATTPPINANKVMGFMRNESLREAIRSHLQ